MVVLIYKFFKFLIPIVIIGFLLLAISCNKDEGPIIIPPITSGTLSTTDTISYTKDIQPIFTNNCIGCHNNTHPQLDLTSGLSYNELLVSGASAPYIDTTNATLSILYVRMTTDMPSSGILPATETNKVLKWIEEGGKNN